MSQLHEISNSIVNWSRLVEVATTRFDGMLERLGWFDEAFEISEEVSSPSEDDHRRLPMAGVRACTPTSADFSPKRFR